MKVFAAVVVQIIGLAVLRNESELGGMHVVLPSIAQASLVERHSAILIFKDTDRVDDGNEWTRHALKPMPGHSYVELKGERIRFLVNGTNPPAVIPALLPRLTASCNVMTQLSAGYQPPDYAAAAAVARIPKGSANACRNDNGRIDTRVRMVNTGNFHIVACDKSITIRDGARVIIANVPTAWVESETAEGKKELRHLHSSVYFQMAAQSRIGCHLQHVENVDECDPPRPKPPVAPRRDVHIAAAVVHRGNPEAPYGIATLKAFTTFECSNTQWP